MRKQTILRPRRSVAAFFALFVLVSCLRTSLQALIVTEIMYHSADLDDRPHEWIELYNENADPLDLSGYTICNGVDFVLPSGTWLDGRSFLVVCASAANVQARYDITNVVGDWFLDPQFSTSLSNGGERIEICNPGGRTVAAVRYNDRGKWPAGADGTGHSLSLIDSFSDIDDPDSWTLSVELGGTPGGPNGHIADEGGGPPPASGLDAAGFVLKWLALGPYTGSGCSLGARLTADWLKESPGGVKETDLLWASGQVVNTNYSLAESDGLHPNAGTTLPTVKAFSGLGDTINLNDVIYPPDPEQVMAYAFIYVDNVTAAPLAVDVACASDDAICVLLGGSYVHVNDACRGVGGPGEIQDRAPATLAVGKNLVAVKVFENGGGWSFRLRFEERGTGVPITSRSKIQVTTDHTKGLRFGGGGTPIEPTDEPPPPGDAPGESPVVLSEGFFRTAGQRWIEIHNRTEELVDLSGYHFTDDPSNLTKSTLPAGTTIPAGAYASFTEAQLGLDFSVGAPPEERVFVALVDPEGKRVLDAYNFEPPLDGYSEARVDGDDKLFTDAADPTRDQPNEVSVSTDVVIHEIMYHPIDGDNRKEYIELHNKGPVAVDLTGWRMSDGVNFDFPPGTVIPAGGYLVIARDPSLFTGPASIYGLPESQVVGPGTPEALVAFGGLRDSGERITLSDPLGRTADTVRYHDGGEWPRWADGLGSSLELIDANQDNRHGQAWDASDDSAKATAQTYSYVARHGNRDSELAIALLSAGIALVDDIEVVGGGVSVVDRPLVDAGATWRFLKGTQEPPANWKDPAFNDGAWASGATGIGYGDNDDATILDDMQGSYLTVFLRKSFTVTDRSAIDELFLSVIIDDGFYAYINGTQVAEYNVASPAFDAAALSAIEPGVPVEIDISAFKDLLVNGTNVLAVQVHNAGLASTDLSCNPRLVDRTTTIGGGSNKLTNGNFEANTAGWVIEGTHIRSGRTTQSPISGSGSLKIIASGRGDNKVNRIETPEANGTGMGALTANQDVSISFKARWVVGSQSLLTNGYDHEMARSHRLDVPLDLGTPGAINQVTERRIAQTGSPNLGPVIADVSQDPPVPGAGESVKVRARIVDSDGVGAVTLRYSLNNPSASPSAVTMSRIPGTDFFEGTVPGQALATRVVFYITAADSGGRTGRYPVDITARTHPMLTNPPSANLNDHRWCVYRHDVKSPATAYHSYRFFMTQAKQDEMSNRRLHSNDPVEGSFVFGGTKLYYESHIRFGGSPFARAGWGGSFRVRMPRDNPLHGRIRRFGLEDHHGSGVDARERISHYLIRQQNRGVVPVPYADVFILVRWQVNDVTTGTREHYWVPDGDFISLWFPGDDEGDFLELDDRFVFNDSGGMAGNADARLLYPPPYGSNDTNGANKENYRFFFGLRAKNGADEYANLIAFARVMDPSRTSDATFDQQIRSYMDVEQMLRLWAVEMNIDDWDTWGMSRGKNCYLYRTEAEGLFHLIAWDLELTYGSVNSALPSANPGDAFNPGGFSEVNRLFNRPWAKRMYYAILAEMVNGTDRWFHSDYLSDYANKLATLGMSNVGIALPGGFIDQRCALLEQRIRSAVYPQVRLTITTNGGNAFSSPQPVVSISGSAPADISYIVVSRGGAEGTLYAPSFTSMTSWTLPAIPLVPGPNALSFLGLDLAGNPVDVDTITVTSTASWNAPALTGLSPSSALAGENIEVFGHDFHNGLKVFFGSTESPAVTYDENGATPGRIVARVPPGSGTVNVTVRNLDGQTSNALQFAYSAPPPMFIRGDANGDGVLDISDALKILLHLFAGKVTDCEDAMDVDDSEALNVTDAVGILNYLFKQGTAPRPPFPAEGVDPAGTALGCSR